MPTKRQYINSPRWSFYPEPQIDNETGNSSKFQLAFIAIYIFTIAGCLIFINNDLWQDELYTLEHFVLVPVQTTLSDYHSTNNHVVFSLIENVYLKTIGISELSELLNKPWLARMIPFLFSILSVLILYRGLKKHFGIQFALIAVIIYASSLQVLTFSCQVRGYSLALFLCSLLFISILNYARDKKLSQLFIVFMSGALLLINLPTAVYLYASMLMLLFDYILYKHYRGDKGSVAPDVKLFAALAFAFLVFAIFYYLKKDQIDQNTLLQQKENDLLTLLRQPLIVGYRFFDFRIYLLILPMLAMFGLKGQKMKISIFLLGCLIIPFILYLINRPPIILRIWVILLPVFAIFMAQICLPWVKNIKQLYVFGLLLIATTIISLLVLRSQSLSKHSQNLAPLDLRYQYHLFGFNPSEVSIIAGNYQGQIVVSDSKLAGIEFYLTGIAYSKPINDNLRSSPELLLIADDSQALFENGINNSMVIDSGANNNTRFYKWYRVKRPK